jgi:hypothetical protein
MDIRRRLPLPASYPIPTFGADTLPRAAAIAAILISQMETQLATSPSEQPGPRPLKGSEARSAAGSDRTA